MKHKITGIFYIAGFVLILAGAIAKIQHYPLYYILLLSGVLLYIIGGMLKQGIIGKRL